MEIQLSTNRINGVGPFHLTGHSVASAGDFNGDGLSDVIIGAHGSSPVTGGADAGSSYIIFGTSEPMSVLNLSALSGLGFRMDGGSSNETSGWSVACAGDFNGDGLSDVIIGAPEASPYGRTHAGSSYVVFGTEGVIPQVLDLNTLNGTQGFRINGATSTYFSGHSVASAGDFNGDGLSDVIIGAPDREVGGSGSSFVVFGTKSIIPNGILDLDTLSPTQGFRINGVAAQDSFGFSVANAGDFNDDGLDDVIIGAPKADPLESNAGSSYVVFGTTEVIANGVLNLTTTINVTRFIRIDGVATTDLTGFSVASAGDFNDDNISDVIIGAFGAHHPLRPEAGSSYVVFGTKTAFANGALDLQTLNGTQGIRIDGAITLDNIGYSVASAGDVNFDNINDVIIGAYGGDSHENGTGTSYVVFGTKDIVPNGVLDLKNLSVSQGIKINGVGSGQGSKSVACAGDFNGDNITDLIIGTPHAGMNDVGASFLLLSPLVPTSAPTPPTQPPSRGPSLQPTTPSLGGTLNSSSPLGRGFTALLAMAVVIVLVIISVAGYFYLRKLMRKRKLSVTVQTSL